MDTPRMESHTQELSSHQQIPISLGRLGKSLKIQCELTENVKENIAEVPRLGQGYGAPAAEAPADWLTWGLLRSCSEAMRDLQVEAWVAEAEEEVF